MKKWLVVILIAVFLAAVFGGIYLNRLDSYRNLVENITYSDIDITALPDGTYEGEYNVDFIYARVRVVVLEGTIKEIKLLEHKNGRGAPAERIIDDMIRTQSIDVDTVSGATGSSRVIRKAVDNALSKALQ